MAALKTGHNGEVAPALCSLSFDEQLSFQVGLLPQSEVNRHIVACSYFILFWVAPLPGLGKQGHIAISTDGLAGVAGSFA